MKKIFPGVIIGAALAALGCGCISNNFFAVSISGKADGGVYCIENDKKITHTSLPRLNYMIRNKHNRLYYATQNGTANINNRYGNVVVLQKSNNGEMKILQTVSVNGITPCHLAISPCGKILCAANYSSGTVSEFRIDRDGRLNHPPVLHQHTGKGATKRQNAPHPHFTGFNPATGELFVSDLGTDEIVIYRNRCGKLQPEEKLKLTPGTGPRHLAFAPDGNTIYTANELDSTATSFVRTAAGWKKVETLSTRPANPSAKKNFPGAIKITADGRFFFITNRGDDTIAMFETSSGGRFRLCGNTPAQGQYPSDILLSDNDTVLRVINLKNGTAAKFKVNQAAATLEALPGTQSVPRGIGLCQ